MIKIRIMIRNLGIPSGSEPVNDAGLVEVVRGHLEFDTVAGGQADEALSHFSGDMRENEMIVGERHAEHGSREDCDDPAFNIDGFFQIHLISKRGRDVNPITGAAAPAGAGGERKGGVSMTEPPPSCQELMITGASSSIPRRCAGALRGRGLRSP